MGILLIGIMCLPVLGKYGGGTGVAGDPYLIYDPCQMNMIGADPCDWDKHFKLMADIDLGNYNVLSYNLIGDYFKPFTGSFDGNGHTIRNFNYYFPEGVIGDNIGLFGRINDPCSVINDLTLIDPCVSGIYVGSLVGLLEDGRITGCSAVGAKVKGLSWAGGLVGYSTAKEIANCYVEVEIVNDAYYSEYLGGLVGYNSSCCIINCQVEGRVRACGRTIGGLAGYNDDYMKIGSLISDCNTVVEIVVNCSECEYIGGLVGYNSSCNIYNCQAEGNVTASGNNIGGLIGTNTDPALTGGLVISECCAVVEVVGNGDSSNNVGGLVGSNDYSSIINCRAEGSVTASGDNIGGMVGKNSDPSMLGRWEMTNCYAKVDVVGNVDESNYVGGMVGSNSYCSIFNCRAEGSVTAGGFAIGGLVGWNNDPSLSGGWEISNCYTKVEVIDEGESSSYIGGLVGYNEYYSIINCQVEGSVTASGNNIGGLVGINFSDPMMTGATKISNCYTDVEVVGNDLSSTNIGGIVGINFSKITNCQSKGCVKTNGQYVGGLVGSQTMMTSSDTIANCCATGDVAGNTYVGGLVGMNNSPMGGTVIEYCYATGKVRGGDPCMPASMFMVGGLVGYSMMCGVTESFWDVESSGLTSSSGGVGLSTAEMQTRSTYIEAGWDFTRESGNGGQDIWLIEDGLDYPQLAGLYKYGGGEGVESDPYLIYTVAELSLAGDKPEGHFRLMSDIDWDDFTGSFYGMIGEYPDYPFRGVFDGNGYMIKNFSYETSAQDCVGLFGYVEGENAEIKNLIVNNIEIEAGTGDYAGGVAGYNYGGRISNVYVTGSVSGWGGVGGLAGVNYDGIISRCGAEVIVDGYEDVGGLVGTNCYQISNCLAASDVLGMRFTGGLVGYNWDGSIINSYNSGQAIGLEYWGGLVGYNNGGTVGNSFWDGQIGGLNNGIGTALTTEEMQDPCTFIEAGWDFVGETENGTEDIWRMCGEGLDYAHLTWKHTTKGDLVCPDGVQVNDLAYFMEWWLAGDCVSYEDCQGADINKDGGVDLRDFAVVGQNWMEIF